jgi:hypothetical protein
MRPSSKSFFTREGPIFISGPCARREADLVPGELPATEVEDVLFLGELREDPGRRHRRATDQYRASSRIAASRSATCGRIASSRSGL